MSTGGMALIPGADPNPLPLSRRENSEDEGGWGHFSRVEDAEAATLRRSAVSKNKVVPLHEEMETPKRAVSVQTAPPPPMSSSSSRLVPSDRVSSSTSCPDFGSLDAARSRVSHSGITFSEAKGEIWKERLRGPLVKQGFRHRKLWVARWVVLSGRMLTYFAAPQDETPDYRKARGSLELTGDTVVAYDDHDDGTFGFIVLSIGDKKRSQSSAGVTGSGSVSGGGASGSTDLIPIARHADDASWIDEDDNGNGGSFLTCGLGAPPKRKQQAAKSHQQASTGWFSGWFGGGYNLQEEVWRFRARSEAEREMWVRAIQRIVALIRRVEMTPTLVGVGSIDHHYDIRHDIGTGRFGTVKLAVAKTTGNLFAVKVLDKAKFAVSPDSSMALNMEIRVIKKVTRHHDHPNICKTYHSFGDNLHVYYVMEYLGGGSLQKRIDRRGKYSEKDAAYVVFQIAGALKELHSSGIVLCDINPGNLLYEREDSEIIKVAEFGRALIVPGPSFA